jgi:hypothetical protein
MAVPCGRMPILNEAPHFTSRYQLRFPSPYFGLFPTYSIDGERETDHARGSARVRGRAGAADGAGGRRCASGESACGNAISNPAGLATLQCGYPQLFKIEMSFAERAPGSDCTYAYISAIS